MPPPDTADAESQSSAQDAPDLAAALARLVRRPELQETALQPVVDLSRGVVCGYELLARFPSPPAAPPDAWLAAADPTLAATLEARMVGKALSRRPELPADCFLSLNLSTAAALRPEVQAAFEVQDRLEGVVVEVKGRPLATGNEALAAALLPLRERGAMVAVDDAGPAYELLRRILELRPEFVKADQALVRGVDREPGKATTLQTLATYAERVEAWLVAQGVERLEELDTLVRLGIPLAQGFLLGRPRPGPGPLDADLARHMRAQAGRREAGDSIGSLLEQAPVVPDDSSAFDLSERLLNHPDEDVLVLVDDRGHPTGVLSRARGLAGDAPSPPLCVDGRSPLGEVAARAMARGGDERFEPVLCCDREGRLLGLIRVERLVKALAEG